jgi:uncharacterized protein YceH (UPF0502 family)
MDWQLDATETRVLGALLEKEITTPDYYPLSTNALVNACNQKSNREPVVSYDDDTVEVVSVMKLRLVTARPLPGGRGSVTSPVESSRRFPSRARKQAVLAT